MPDNLSLTACAQHASHIPPDAPSPRDWPDAVIDCAAQGASLEACNCGYHDRLHETEKLG